MALALSPFTAGTSLLTAASTAAFPPVSWGMVTNWITTAVRCVPEFDLVLWCDATGDNITAAKLYGGIPQEFTIGATAVTSIAFPVITKTAHGLQTGDGPIQFTSTLTIPAGLSLATNYWVIVLTANTFQVAASFADAMAATPVPVLFTGNGTGTVSFTGAAACQRVRWCEILDIAGKQIGRAGDGAVALTSSSGWRQRFAHDPMTVAYALSATLSAGVLYASVYPVQAR